MSKRSTRHASFVIERDYPSPPGREGVSGGPPGGPKHVYSAAYQDIVPDERIVLADDMHLDGFDKPADRERGTRDLLDKLEAELRR